MTLGAIGAVGTIKTVGDDLLTLLGFILGVKDETRTGSAVKVDRIKDEVIETRVAFVGSNTSFTLGHVAVRTVESLEGLIVHNVLVFPTFIIAVGLLRRVKTSERMG